MGGKGEVDYEIDDLCRNVELHEQVRATTKKPPAYSERSF